MKVNWFIHQHMLDIAHACGHPRIDEAIRQSGHELCVSNDPVGTTRFDVPFPEESCVVAYGPHQFVSRVKRAYAGKWQPCAYHRLETLSYSGFSPYLGDLMLNSDFVLLPFGEVVRRKTHDWPNGFFLRPDAVTKAFTGNVFTRDNFDHEMNSLIQLCNPSPETLCVLSTPKTLDAEYRFFIVNGRVVTGSEYRWDNANPRPVSPLCEKVAWMVAERSWQADTVYVCDVGLINSTEARVIELNTFSCAGLYGADTEKLVHAVSNAAWREYTGDDV